jgi:hypothetical protein
MRVKQVSSGPRVRTMKVKLLKGVVMGHGDDGESGDIYELPRHKAIELINHGQAVETDEGDELKYDEAPAGVKDPETIRQVTIESPTSRDPKPEKRGKGKAEA